MKPGDLVRRIVREDEPLAVVLRIYGDEVEILTDTGETKWVYYDALEAVDEL
jgi:hypothetical protein